MSLTDSPTLGIVGAGVFGCLMALRFSSAGWKVTLFDRDEWVGSKSCSYVAAGMLSPFCELELGEKLIFDLGMASLELWPKIIHEFGLSTYFQKEGSLVVAHPLDSNELLLFKKRLEAKFDFHGSIQELSLPDLHQIEPELDPKFVNGIYFPLEGQIDTRQLLTSMKQGLKKRGTTFNWGQEVSAVQPHKIKCYDKSFQYDWVLDCRGVSAQVDLKNLRAVRGELIWIESKDIHLRRPVRLLHPRSPIYIVPRPNGKFIVGATNIESEDYSPISVRSTLELLSAAFTIHSSFGEGRLIETVVGLRPAFPHHLPQILFQKGLVRVNGLYRHGYLISPQLSEITYQFIVSGKKDSSAGQLFVEETL